LQGRPVFCDLAVLGAVGGGLASSAYEWLLQRLGAVIAQRGIAAVALGRCALRPWHLKSLGFVKRKAAWANGRVTSEITGKKRGTNFRYAAEREDNPLSPSKPEACMVRGVRTECTADIPQETKLPPCDSEPIIKAQFVR